MQFITLQNITIAYSTPEYQALRSQHFQPLYWQENDAIIGQSCGRNTTWFVQQAQYNWVLRHYWRGGFMAKISKDLYCFPGIDHTRPVAELRLLEEMYQMGLPVPKPVAAKVERMGLFYRGDILIDLIPDAQDLHALLSVESMPCELWQRLGQTIARFHKHGFYHADLNIKNILIKQDKFYLIDFDRGEQRTPRPIWQRANLSRLRRSFDKEKTKLPSLHFDKQNWQSLLLGYQAFLQ